MFWQNKKTKPKIQNKIIPPKYIKSRPEKEKPIPKKVEQKNQVRESSKKTFDARKEFLKVFNRLINSYQYWDVWRDFIVIYACAISNPMDKQHYNEREELYLQTIKKYNKQEQPLFSELAAYTVMALEENPEQDFLGSIYMSLNLGNKNNGQYFTPYNVCELMAEITMRDSVLKCEKEGYITINDPCCGAGAILIAGIHAAKKQLEKAGYNYQHHILVAAQDIDLTAALMCYIQLSLLGVAGYIKVGNSLIDPIIENDSKENYWFTPMYFFPVWSMRRLFKKK